MRRLVFMLHPSLTGSSREPQLPPQSTVADHQTQIDGHGKRFIRDFNERGLRAILQVLAPIAFAISEEVSIHRLNNRILARRAETDRLTVAHVVIGEVVTTASDRYLSFAIETFFL